MVWSSILRSLLTVFVFSILAVGSVESYNCVQMMCENGNCPGTPTTCGTPESCFNQIQTLEVPSPGTNLVHQQKGCTADKKSCEMEFSATLGNRHKFKYKNHCCTGDQCNKDDISLPPASSEVNGVECPACYNEQNKTCPTTTTLKCTGAEKKCLEVTGTDEASNLVLYGKGCATENACSLDMKVFSNVQIKTSCSGSPALRSIASFPIVLLLLKTLL